MLVKASLINKAAVVIFKEHVWVPLNTSNYKVHQINHVLPQKLSDVDLNLEACELEFGSL